MNKIIVITQPSHINKEREICRELFNSGLEKLHVRKNQWNEVTLTEWLSFFSDEELKKITVHHHYSLGKNLNIGGVHLSYSKHLQSGKINSCTFSSSVHNWEEARVALNYCDYVFISPVFDSISKNSYAQNKDLLSIPDDLKHKKIIALGGINANTISRADAIGYYGAATLGYIWNNASQAVENYTKLKNKMVYAE